MNISRTLRIAAVLAACAALSGCVASLDSKAGASSGSGDRTAFAENVVGQWSETAALAAHRLMERYT